MGTATHLVALEQRPIIPGDYIIPDFLARFQPGCSVCGFGREDSSGFECLIEVKSTSKDHFKIGGSRLRRLRGFAATFDLPLLFAVRFLRFESNAVWVIVDASRQGGTCVKITIQDLIAGVRHILWDEVWYMVLPNTYFVSVFDPTYNEPGVAHQDYGTQRELQIVSGDKAVSFTGAEATVYSAFFEAFHPTEVKVQKQNHLTYQFLAPQLLFCSMADMVYILNRLRRDEQGQTVYDASKMLVQLEPTLYDMSFISKVAASLAYQDLLFRVGFDEKDGYLEKWRLYGGKK